MLRNQEIARLESVYSEGGTDLYEDAREMIKEIKRLRAALGTVAALDYFMHPSDDALKSYQRLQDAIMLANLALGNGKGGEPTTLASVTGPASEEAARMPAKGTDLASQGPKVGQRGIEPKVAPAAPESNLGPSSVSDR
ncbi:MAG: hypothetical protein DMF62_02345 [Acidobacteria bacterium]|nr:MAG: hypothetical protein DMF62_02345 [Acidobacteriota bacterium]